MSMPLELHESCHGGPESPTVQCVVDVQYSETQLVTGTESDALGPSGTLNVDCFSDTISEVDIKAADVNDTQCCNCSRTFQQKKKPYVGLLRYSLKLLNLENSWLAAKGNFVCNVCRSYFEKKKRRSAKAIALSGAKRSTGSSLAHEVLNQAACPNCYTVRELDSSF